MPLCNLWFFTSCQNQSACKFFSSPSSCGLYFVELRTCTRLLFTVKYGTTYCKIDLIYQKELGSLKNLFFRIKSSLMLLTKLGMMFGISSILKKVGRKRKRMMKMETLSSQGRILMVNKVDCE